MGKLVIQFDVPEQGVVVHVGQNDIGVTSVSIGVADAQGRLVEHIVNVVIGWHENARVVIPGDIRRAITLAQGGQDGE
jgi:hypothetical protein